MQKANFYFVDWGLYIFYFNYFYSIFIFYCDFNLPFISIFSHPSFLIYALKGKNVLLWAALATIYKLWYFQSKIYFNFCGYFFCVCVIHYFEVFLANIQMFGNFPGNYYWFQIQFYSHWRITSVRTWFFEKYWDFLMVLGYHS